MENWILQMMEKKPLGKHLSLSILCLSLILLFGLLDYWVSSVNLFIFYAFFVVCSSMFLSKTDGVLASLLCAVVNFYTNSKYLTYSSPVFLYIDFVIDISFFVFIVFIVVQLRNSLMREKKLARTDFLTGLWNRRHFMEKFGIKNSEFLSEYSLCYMDIDRYFEFVEEAGLVRADEMIKIAAKFIRSRYPDVFRYEENRFMILFDERDGQTAFEKMHHLRHELQEELSRNGITVTFSVGIALVSRRGHKLSEILLVLFKLVQSVKQEGGNQIKFSVVK